MPFSRQFYQYKMSNPQSEQRNRSKSKKRGISVSLTPSKDPQNVQVSSFDVSRCTVKQINQLPVIHLQSSNSKNHQTIKFTYNSPGQFSGTKNESVVDANDIRWPEAVSSMVLNDVYPSAGKSSQATAAFQIEKRSVETLRMDGRQIRPSVFEVVEEISAKMQFPSRESHSYNRNKEEPGDGLEKSRQAKANKAPEKSETKKSPKKKEKKPSPIKEDLSVVDQKTLETSQQIFRNPPSSYQQQPIPKVLELTSVDQNNSFNQQNRRLERLKMAQQKLMNIIHVCDYGL